MSILLVQLYMDSLSSTLSVFVDLNISMTVVYSKNIVKKMCIMLTNTLKKHDVK